jgi:hypothetical protein
MRGSMCLPMSVCLCGFLCIRVCLTVCLCMYVCLYVFVYTRLSVCLSVCLSICLYVSICVSLFCVNPNSLCALNILRSYLIFRDCVFISFLYILSCLSMRMSSVLSSLFILCVSRAFIRLCFCASKNLQCFYLRFVLCLL